MPNSASTITTVTIWWSARSARSWASSARCTRPPSCSNSWSTATRERWPTFAEGAIDNWPTRAKSAMSLPWHVRGTYDARWAQPAPVWTEGASREVRTKGFGAHARRRSHVGFAPVGARGVRVVRGGQAEGLQERVRPEQGQEVREEGRGQDHQEERHGNDRQAGEFGKPAADGRRPQRRGQNWVRLELWGR